jgi:hypothetical protein
VPDTTEPPDTRSTHPWLRLTTFGLPTQIEGTSPAGHRVYFRFRWGYASVEVDDVTVWDGHFGDDMCGVMDETVALRVTAAAYDLWAALRLTPHVEELRAATKAAADNVAATYDTSPQAKADSEAALARFMHRIDQPPAPTG